MMPKAYSYVRFSSLRQERGDSLRRQAALRDAWLARHDDMVLDDTLRLKDLGISGFKGKNRRDGIALAGFLAAIESGAVEPGSVLILESLDRLSRDMVSKAFRVFMGILEAGVNIVTLAPERKYTEASINDIAGLLEPIIHMSRAYEESAMKGSRSQAKWKARRAKLADGEKIVFEGNCPAWLRATKDKTDFEVDPVARVVVKRIFDTAAAGFGARVIVKQLTEAGIPTIGRGQNGTKQPLWTAQYVRTILINRAAIGEFQPQTTVDGRKKIGDPVPGYFPAVVSKSLFNKVQLALKGRAPQRGRPSSDCKNLFSGLLVDARDGRRMLLVNKDKVFDKGTDRERLVDYRYLCNRGHVQHEKATDDLPAPWPMTFPYGVFESAILVWLDELNVDEFKPAKGDGIADLARLLDDQADVLADIAVTKRKVTERAKGTKVSVLLDLLVELEAKRDEIQAAIDVAKLKATNHSTKLLAETKSLAHQIIAAGDNTELLDLRERIRGRIRALVDSIYVLIWERQSPRGKQRCCLAQIHLFDGQVRVLLMDSKADVAHSVVVPASRIDPKRDLRNFREPFYTGMCSTHGEDAPVSGDD
jgi:DNA invertase Pin-like site-specific DNA recombinase